MPIVPYTIPTCSTESANPPNSREATKNGFIILMRKASGKRYTNINTKANQMPGFLK